MTEERRTVYVGSEYKEAFESICFLIDNGGLTGMEPPASNDGTSIFSGRIEYRLSGRQGRESEAAIFHMQEDGATWFSSLRGGSVENGNADWMDFMKRVQKQFHKNYSVVEYKQQMMSAQEREERREAAVCLLTRFIDLFYKSALGGIDVSKALKEAADASADDVYGVAMRLELATKAGDPFPILGKVYFGVNDTELWPMPKELADQMDRNICAIVPDQGDTNDRRGTDGSQNRETIDKMLNALEKMVKRSDFAKYLYYGGEDSTDTRRVNETRRQMPTGRFELCCHLMDVLYITHISKQDFVCELVLNGQPILRAVLGINNRLTVSCCACKVNGKPEVLVSHNDIRYTKDGEYICKTLDTNDETFGLSEEEIAEILEYSRLKEHFMHPDCDDQSCSNVLRCRSQLLEFLDNSQKRVYFCKQCPHPSVIYTDFAGVPHFTKKLKLLTDKLDVVEKDQTTEYGVCRCCGRTFTKAGLGAAQMCKGLCAQVELFKEGKCDSETDQKAKLLYKRYCGLLPLGKRLAATFSAKRCYEDREVILLVLKSRRSTQVYAFNKLNAGEYGYLPVPVSLG